MKASILTSCFNCAPWLQACINSVLNQTYTNWEWIIVEDRSRDGSLKILQKAAKKCKKIKVVPYAIIVLSDRTNEESKNKLLKILNKNNIKFYSLTNEKEVIKEAIRILKPSKEIIKKLKDLGKI